jgi:DNA-binding HxlR family transcriptional regulator
VEPARDESAPGERVLKSRLAVDLLANKWRLTILQALAPGLLRHGELQREVGKISHKALTQALRSLERDGLVERRMHKSVPPKVEYLLTPLGESLAHRLDPLCRWAEEHQTEIRESQSSFDERERSWAAPSDPAPNL